MAVTKVVVKNSEIDGKPITWQVLAITAFIGGDYQTLELKLNKTEALLANMLLGSNEDKPVAEARKADEGEQEAFKGKIKSKKNELFDDEDDEA